MTAVWNVNQLSLHEWQSLRNDAELQEGNVSWLRTRLAALIEVCTESDAQRQAAALSKLSTDFKGLLTSLSEVIHTHFKKHRSKSSAIEENYQVNQSDLVSH